MLFQTDPLKRLNELTGQEIAQTLSAKYITAQSQHYSMVWPYLKCIIITIQKQK